jgi:type I restriction enzyme S subunit
MSSWPEVALSEFARPVSRTVTVFPGQTYRTIGVKWWGQGAYERATIDGGQTAAKTLSIVRDGDMIINKIWVRHGSTAIASADVDGCAASGEFPTFELNRDVVIPAWIHWQTKTPGFWAKCDALSRGTSGKNRIRPDLFLTVRVPLPPLSEQRRVVKRIEGIANAAQLAQSLRKEALAEARELLAAAELTIWPTEALKTAPTLSEVTTYLSRGRQSEQGDSNHYLIKTQHVQQGSYVSTALRLAAHAAAKVNEEALARAGDVLIACSAAGCLGRVAQYVDHGCPASTDTHVAIARANEDLITPEYLYAYLVGAQGQRQLRSRERGDWKREKISFRLAELNLSDLRNVPVPLPSVSEQTQIVMRIKKLHAKVQSLNLLQSDAGAELDALLPSILSKAFSGEL